MTPESHEFACKGARRIKMNQNESKRIKKNQVNWGEEKSVASSGNQNKTRSAHPIRGSAWAAPKYRLNLVGSAKTKNFPVFFCCCWVFFGRVISSSLIES
jgi:hypothetical protein